MELLPGTMVTRNVRLRQPLRAGGMGHVWVADHLTLGMNVAVKFISDKLAVGDPVVLAQFVREASTAARIKSDHVVQTHDCGVMADGTPYIVMELLVGENLEDRLSRTRVLELRDAGRVIVQTSMALTRAHKLGFVHRDIKPANLFLCATDEGLHVKVLDFGVAQSVRAPASPGFGAAGQVQAPAAGAQAEPMVGTLPFLSPEQFKGEGSVDHRADLWALAVVAYRCVTGAFPFQGQTSGLLCLSVCTGAFVRPRSLRNDAPIGMDEWFGKAFNQDPAQRFQSAKEMALAFVRIVPASAEDFGEELMSGIHLAPPGLESGPGGPGGLDTTPSTVLPALAPRRTRKRSLQPLTIALLGGGLAIVAAAGLVLARSSGVRATAAGADGRSESQASGASRAAESTSSADSEVNSGADGGAESPEASGSAAPAATGTAGAQAVPKGFLPAARGSAGKKGRRAHPTGEDYGF